MSLQTRWKQWETLSTVKRVALAVGLVVALLLAAWLVWSVAGWFTSRHDRKFDQERAAEKLERDTLKAQTEELTLQRETAIVRAEAAEKEAEDLKAQIAIKETALAAAGPKIQEADRKLLNEDQRYTQALAQSGADIDPRARCLNNCATAKRLGIKPQSAECVCE